MINNINEMKPCSANIAHGCCGGGKKKAKKFKKIGSICHSELSHGCRGGKKKAKKLRKVGNVNGCK